MSKQVTPAGARTVSSRRPQALTRDVDGTNYNRASPLPIQQGPSSSLAGRPLWSRERVVASDVITGVREEGR